MPKIPSIYLILGGAGLALALVAGVMIHLNHDATVRKERDGLKDWQGEVVVAVKNASGNDKVTRETAPEQITQMGVDHRSLLDEVNAANARWLAASQDAARRKAAAEEMRRMMNKAIAQREAAMRRLQEEALTPGTRDDCDTLIREADQVQNLLRETAKEAGI